MPGEYVSVNGVYIHLNCTGTGSPTVVLEAGATGFAQTWSWVQEELAKATRVCSYDRSGMGWSSASDYGYTGDEVAEILRETLKRGGENGPFVLVGHSMGGSFAQIFAGKYADEVVGLGFVDPSHPDQLDPFSSEIRKQQEGFHSLNRLASTLAYTGIMRATNVLGRNAQGLPPQDYRVSRMFAASPGHLRTSYRELAAWDETMAQARRNMSFGNIPVTVISATAQVDGMPDGFLETNHAMHAELSEASEQGHHIKLEGSDHFSILVHQQHADRTAEILADLVNRARNSHVSDT